MKGEIHDQIQFVHQQLKDQGNRSLHAAQIRRTKLTKSKIDLSKLLRRAEGEWFVFPYGVVLKDLQTAKKWW